MVLLDLKLPGIDGHEVLRILKKKAVGLDGVAPRTLCARAEQLYGILTCIVNLSLALCKVPDTWKVSSIVPVPKRQPVKGMNDLRPIALTSCVMKVFEKVVLVHFQNLVSDFSDPLQFAYRKNRSAEDAVLFVLDQDDSQLDKPGAISG